MKALKSIKEIKLDREVKQKQLELLRKGRMYDKLNQEYKALQTSHSNVVDTLKNLLQLAKDGFATAGCLWQIQDAEKIIKNEALKETNDGNGNNRISSL